MHDKLVEEPSPVAGSTAAMIADNLPKMGANGGQNVLAAALLGTWSTSGDPSDRKDVADHKTSPAGPYVDALNYRLNSQQVLTILDATLREDEAHVRGCLKRVHELQDRTLAPNQMPNTLSGLLAEAKGDLVKAQQTRDERLKLVLAFVPK